MSKIRKPRVLVIDILGGISEILGIVSFFWTLKNHLHRKRKLIPTTTVVTASVDSTS